jgi:hypothetical protein
MLPAQITGILLPELVLIQTISAPHPRHLPLFINAILLPSQTCFTCKTITYAAYTDNYYTFIISKGTVAAETPFKFAIIQSDFFTALPKFPPGYFRVEHPDKI